MISGISQSALGLFKSCPKCFWLDKNKKIKRPQGIKASIMGGIDLAMKNSVESSVERRMEHLYLDSLPGAVPFRDRTRLSKFQSWRSFQTVIDGIKIWGELDDLIEFPADSTVAPWDFKSNGQEREWLSYAEMYYQTQMDMYHLLLEGQGLKCTGHGYFTFSWPSGFGPEGLIFSHKTIEVKTNPYDAVKLLHDAVECLESPMPFQGPNCEYCEFINNRRGS